MYWVALRLIAGLLFAGLALTGCSVEEPTEVEIPPIRREVKAPKPEALFAKAEEEPHRYELGGRRDPFLALIRPKKPQPVIDEEKRDCPPLQAFEIASLKLVGIVWGELGRKAMLKAPDGRGYAIAENTLVGPKCARVRRIESNAVIMEETRRDVEGNVLKEEVILRLKEREG